MTATVTTPAKPLTHSLVDDWSTREPVAEAMIPLIGRLFRDRGVITAIYLRPKPGQQVPQEDPQAPPVRPAHRRPRAPG